MVRIGERITDPRLQELFDNNKNVYSISKLNTIENCEYEAWLTYKRKQRGTDGIYGILGGKTHDTLENIMCNKATKSDLLPALQDELADLDLLNIDFPKDFRGGTLIRDNWMAAMTHFCNNFVRPNGKFTTEEFILFQFGDNRWIQGYIDLIRHNKDKSLTILDWKTSTDFNKEDLMHHGRQLVVYAIAKESEGYKVKSVAWIMLKYVEVSFTGKARSNSKNKTELVKILNRGKLLKELKSYIESDLCDLGYDEIDIEIMLNEAIDSNSFDTLPQEIKDKYKIKPYVREYELTDELRAETLLYINEMANRFESKSDDEKDWVHRKFTKTNGKGEEKDDSFYCNALCNHRKTCPHIKKYNELRLLTKQSDDELF